MPTKETEMDRSLSRLNAFALSFVVAFCSIVYEMIFSEALRVVFGGTAKRYAITIGLFMFALGIGSFFFNYLDRSWRTFLVVEIFLSLVGPVGLIYIIWINSHPNVVFPFKRPLLLTISHLPVIAVGFLSGLEIPLLSELVRERTGRLAERFETSWLIAATPYLSKPERGDHESFSDILAVDYVGSLAGTVVFAFLLFPELGLIPSVFVLGLLNTFAALYYAARVDVLTPAGPIPSVDRLLATGKTGLLVVLVISGGYSGVLLNSNAAVNTVSEMHVEGAIAGEYQPNTAQVEVTEQHRTKYQDVTIYNRNINNNGWEKCVRMDSHLQMCDSWVEEYHHGLVDVPMQSLYGNDTEDLNVLIIGGGDWMAVNQLRKYGVNIDLVDIDSEFTEYTKDHPYFEQYHDNAYEYQNLNVVHADAYTHLRQTDKKYDLILMDTPGIKTDDMHKLYTVEYFELIRNHLSDDGYAVTWAYSPNVHGDHHKVYMNTIHEAGFTSYLEYNAYADWDMDNQQEQSELFYVFSAGETPPPQTNFEDSNIAYLRKNNDQYNSLHWRSTPTYRGVQPNRVFDHNPEIVVDS